MAQNYMAQLAKAERRAEQLREKMEQSVSRQAQASFAGVRDVVGTYAPFLSDDQRQELAGLLRKSSAGKPVAGATAKKSGRKTNAGATLVPKYQLPTGETWAGRGRPHAAFVAWLKTSEGRTWKKAHPGENYPAFTGTKPATKKAAKKSPAKQAGKRAARKVSKPARKNVRKTAKKPVRKATRKRAKS